VFAEVKGCIGVIRGAIHKVIVEKQGPTKISKASFPMRYGTYSEIRTPEYEFRFNLNGEIKFVRGLTADWPHPAEQLKRTDGNDWVYYTVGDDSTDKGIASWLGEYYMPCLPYPSNPIWEVNYFSNPVIMNAFAAWPQLYANLHGAKNDRRPPKAKALINKILKKDDTALHERSKKLQAIIGGRASVLPPDTRHIDYETIPLNIADGCLYHCKFCCVKSTRKFQARSTTDIYEQVKQLKSFYGRNLENYNALFLGNHDALEAGADTILTAASKAFDAFGFEARTDKPLLFLFASVDSLLKSKNRLFKKIDELPFYTYINIGLESADKSTLALIGKPLSEVKVREAFLTMLDMNASYENIEVTANFVIGEGLPEDHYQSMKALLGSAPANAAGKGAVYLSTLKNSPKKRELLPLIHEIKAHSNLPVHLYLIQRL
jgi:hypothetical protein